MTQPCRVLYVHNSADFYGASRCLLRLIESLDRQRFLPFVVLPAEGPLSRDLKAIGITVFIQPNLSVISRYFKSKTDLLKKTFDFPLSVISLYRVIQQNQIDLIHTNVGVIPSAALAAFFSSKPHFWHIREFFSEFKMLWNFYEKYMETFSNQILPVSQGAARQFKNQKKVTVVYDGFKMIDFEVDRVTLRRQFKSQFSLDDTFTVGCVGRIKFQRKGQDIFLRALAILKKQGLKIRGLIVGAPFVENKNQQQILVSLIAELDLENEIILTGELSDVRPAYAAMDLFVLPSAQPEPFGGVVIEAMGMKLPVVATNIGGSPEQVEEGITGFLVPPNDPVALADKVSKFYHNRELGTRLGLAGFEKLKNQFLLQDKTREIEEIYLTALNSSSRS